MIQSALRPACRLAARGALLATATAALVLPAEVTAQRADQLAQTIQEQFVEVADEAFAITNVTLIDGTGAAPQPGRTVVVREGRIAEIVAAGEFNAGAMRTVDGSGGTLMPGICLLYTSDAADE